MTKRHPRIGVLGLQGAFQKHLEMFAKIEVPAERVIYPEQIAQVDGLVIPGGESTTMSKILDEMQLRTAIREFSGPIFGTCAGAILLSEDGGDPRVQSLARISIGMKRNGYGRQVDSFREPVLLTFDQEPFPGIFIRAPRIGYLGNKVNQLGRFQDEVVLISNQNTLLATFHPELSDDSRIHQYFIRQFFL